jgi:hypothetical protein
MTDYGCGRCDCHHEMVDFQAEKKAALQFWGDAPSESSTNAD